MNLKQYYKQLKIAEKFAAENNYLAVRNTLWNWFEFIQNDNSLIDEKGLKLLLNSAINLDKNNIDELTRSIKIYEFCAKLDKCNTLLLKNLGKLYSLNGQFDNIISTFSEIAEQENSQICLLCKKIITYFDNENYKNLPNFNTLLKQSFINLFDDNYDEFIRDFIINLHFGNKYNEEQLSKLTFEYGNILLERAEFQYNKWENINFKNINSRLKVGLLPGNFNDGPMGVFLEGVFKNIDKSKLEIFVFETDCYKQDYLTKQIIPNLEHFISCKDKTDKELAEFIYNNGIQILVDLHGFAPGHRLQVFAYKPAPIQITWMGYWATTGLKTMDYIIGDNIVTPENEYHHYIEKVYKLPYCFFHLSTPEDVYTNPLLEVKETPFIKNGYITFGNFSYPAKQTDNVIKVWAEILKNVPNSKLMLKYFSLDDKQNQNYIIYRFQKYGINKERLIFEGGSKRYELLNTYNKIDYTLDTFPYIGGTSTLQSIFMGVPVITKKGNSYLSHIGESSLYNAGLSQFIAEDENDYINKASEFCKPENILKYNKEIRLNIRKFLMDKPLFNTQQFTIDVENMFFDLWNEYLNKNKNKI